MSWGFVSLKQRRAGYQAGIAGALWPVSIIAGLYAAMPPVPGVPVLIEAIGNVIGSIGGFLSVASIDRFVSMLLLPGLAAKGGMTAWLLFAGPDVDGWRQRAAAPG